MRYNGLRKTDKRFAKPLLLATALRRLRLTRKPTNRLTYQWLVVCWLGALVLSPSAALGLDIPAQTLHYAVSYENHNVGQLTVTIQKQDDAYVVTTNAQPSRLARLFVKTYNSVTRFSAYQGKMTLASGSEWRLGKKDQVRSFHINRARGLIEFSSGKHSAFDSDEQFEASAFPLLLMLRAPHTTTRVRAVSPKRAHDYIYQEPVAETVTLPVGKFSTWKISRHSTKQANRSVTVWLSRANNRYADYPIPLKIVIVKKDKTSTLVLRETPTAQ